MAYGATPVSTTTLSTDQFPASAVYVPETANGDFTALEGGPIGTDSLLNNHAPASMYVYDGNDVNAGATTATAVTGDTPGTLSAKLRGLSKIFADVWDSVNHWLQVKVMNGNANGQAVMAGSSPVVIASDQTTLPVKGSFTELASLSAGSLNAYLVPATDVSAYKWLSLQIEGTYSGLLYFLGSNDGIHFHSIYLYRLDTISGDTSNFVTGNSGIMFAGPVQFRYFAVPMQSYTSGTATGTLELYTEAPALALDAVQLAGGGNAVGYVGLEGQDNSGTPEPWKSNLDAITVLASAARTTTQTSADQTNRNHRGVVVVLDMTLVGTGSVTLEIDGKDPVSGKYYPILTGAAVTTNSTNIYTVYPGNTVTANVSASTVLPRTWRIRVIANNANPATYSVGEMMMV